jgi:Peptide methionine sulfoxide reductase
VQTNYEQLVKKFYDIHDPTTLNRQKGDAGTQYRSGIYYRSDEEKQVWRLQSGITIQESCCVPGSQAMPTEVTWYRWPYVMGLWRADCRDRQSQGAGRSH